MKINRVWAMPNSKTFKIKPIKELIQKYVKDNYIVLDPFANEHSIKKEINCKYICNDIDSQFDTDYHLEAQDFMCELILNGMVTCKYLVERSDT